MAAIDYMFSNTDQHLENFGFLVDNKTNQIVNMAPLCDHNQALVADVLENDISDLLYEPTGKTLKESAELCFADANLKMDWNKCEERGLLEFDGKLLTARKKYEALSEYMLNIETISNECKESIDESTAILQKQTNYKNDIIL